ncbi:putative amino acid transporter, transmembrane domain-containing protein [Plasmopara halstedii]
MSRSDDILCVALLFCATFSVGSMSFGFIFAAAGPILATLGVYFISACNLHASVAMSKSFMVVPIHVRTFSDLSYYAFGEIGRFIVVLSEWGVCFLSPIAFFIFGGTILLPCIFAGSSYEEWVPTQWIIVISLVVLPILMIPTLKAAAPLACMGGLMAVLADTICILSSLQSIHSTPRETYIQAHNVIPTFGTILFATGTAIIVPSIQRQHANPARLANLVSITLLFITLIYMLIGIVTYHQFGCMAPATLLDQLPKESPARKVASALLLAHIIISFPLLLNPTMYDLERYILGKDIDHEVLQQVVNQRFADNSSRSSLSISANIVATEDTLKPTASLDFEEELLYGDNAPYVQVMSPSSNASDKHTFVEETYTISDRVNSSFIRAITVWLQAFLAITFQASFNDIISLIGSTAISVSCMIMPCLCYLRLHPIATNTFQGKCDYLMCYLTIISSLVLGIYCAYITIGNIKRDMMDFRVFQGIETSNHVNVKQNDEFPYCYEGERN